MRTENTNYSKEVAETILQQLGGRRFIMMTGAHHFSYYVNENGNTVLKFKIEESKSLINTVLIEYNPLDLYNMHFLQVSVKQDFTFFSKTVLSHSNVYCDQLEELFTDATGLYTRL